MSEFIADGLAGSLLAGARVEADGGVGKSGFGREKGLEALRNHLRTKNIAISLKV